MKNIFFDFDGTLVDNNIRQYRCFLIALNKLKIKNEISFVDYLKLKKTYSSNFQIYEFLFPKKNIDIFLDIYLKNIENYSLLIFDKLQKNSIDYLDEVKKNHLHLITNRQNRNKLLFQLNYLGLKKYFDEIILSRNYATKKDALVKNKINYSSSDIFISDDLSDFNGINMNKFLINSDEPCIDQSVVVVNNFSSLLNI